MKSRINDKQFKRMSRRELLKLTPVLALGAFADSGFTEAAAEGRAWLQRLGLGKAVSFRTSRDDLCRVGPDSLQQVSNQRLRRRRPRS